ncbi:MAG: hypothetical protein PVJ67_03715 [Candidatus Pacearchaeota archaeon]
MFKDKKQIEFILSNEIIYQHEGIEKKTNKLILIAPSANHKKSTLKLKKYMTDVIIELQFRNKLNSDDIKKLEKDTNVNDEIDGKQLLTMIYGILPLEKVELFYDVFWDIMCKNLCFIDGNVPLNNLLKESISEDDEQDIMAAYLENFITPPWKEARKKK